MIEVYGKPDCVWCDAAKKLLNETNTPYKYYSVGQDIGIDFIIENFPGVKTVPIIVVDGFRIGGYESLKSYLEENKNDYGHGAI